RRLLVVRARLDRRRRRGRRLLDVVERRARRSRARPRVRRGPRAQGGEEPHPHRLEPERVRPGRRAATPAGARGAAGRRRAGRAVVGRARGSGGQRVLPAGPPDRPLTAGQAPARSWASASASSTASVGPGAATTSPSSQVPIPTTGTPARSANAISDSVPYPPPT